MRPSASNVNTMTSVSPTSCMPELAGCVAWNTASAIATSPLIHSRGNPMRIDSAGANAARISASIADRPRTVRVPAKSRTAFSAYSAAIARASRDSIAMRM